MSQLLLYAFLSITFLSCAKIQEWIDTDSEDSNPPHLEENPEIMAAGATVPNDAATPLPQDPPLDKKASDETDSNILEKIEVVLTTEEKSKPDSNLEPEPISQDNTISVEVTDPSRWREVNIHNNEAPLVSFFENNITVHIKNGDEAALLYSFKSPMYVKSVSVQGAINIKSVSDKRYDDGNFGIGLIGEGKKQLPFFAPGWLKKSLKDTFPQSGFKSILIMQAVPSKYISNKVNKVFHFVHEHNVWALDESGPIDYSHTLDKPFLSKGLWLKVEANDELPEVEAIVNTITITTEQPSSDKESKPEQPVS